MVQWIQIKGGAKMSLLEGFTSFNFDEGVPYVSITKNGVTFNKAVIMKLDYPAYVQLLINPVTKQIAIKACDEGAQNSTPFYKKKENSNVLSVRWNVKDLLNTLQDIAGWDLSSFGYKVDGSLIKEERAMLFDLSSGKILI